jgi:hypothetical protein
MKYGESVANDVMAGSGISSENGVWRGVMAASRNGVISCASASGVMAASANQRANETEIKHGVLLANMQRQRSVVKMKLSA